MPIRLFTDITANLPQITVLYKGEPAKKTIRELLKIENENPKSQTP
jgi:hypothetical protein